MRGANHLKLMGLGVAAASLFAAPSAHAAIAGATPSNFTDRPTLQSVRISEDHNIGVKSAEFCFDRNVNLGPSFNQDGGPGQNNFHLAGYDSSNWNNNTGTMLNSSAAAIEFGAHNCVRAQFNIVQDVVNSTVGVVDEDAVVGDTGNQAKGNKADAAPLTQTQQGSNLGNTVGPNIVRSWVDPTTNEIRVQYDRVVNVFGEPWHFRYYDQAGNAVEADRAYNAGAPNADVLVLHFPASLNRSVRDAIRVGANRDSIRDASGQVSPVQSVNLLNGGETARPDLVGARISGLNSVDYTFDEPVKVDDIDEFLVYDPNHGPWTGQQATVLNSNQHTVRVWFGPETQDVFRNGLVLAAVDENEGRRGEGAVESNDSAHLRNTIGAIGIGSLPHTAGYTSAPDATGLTFNKDDGTATITFDQEIGGTPVCEIERDPAGEFQSPPTPAQGPRCQNIHLLDNSGNELGHATGIQSVVTGQDGSTQVVVLFGEDRVENAQAVQLDWDAVDGQTGDDNVPQVVARNAAPPATGGGSTPVTPGPGSTPVQGNLGASQVGVSPSTSNPSKASLRIASAKLRSAKSRNAKRVLRLRVNGKASTAKIKIRVLNSKGKVLRTITRTVRTNRTVSITVGRLAKGQRINVRLA